MLQVENICYRYGVHQILSGVSFQLDPNELVVLVGRNGAGKSTLLRCLAGWLKPEAGAVYLDKKNLHTHQCKTQKHLIFVPDIPDFYDELTVWEHLQFIANLYRTQNWTLRSVELLEAFQMMDVCQRFPFMLSHGMRHKLALCMAFLVNPRVLLLDEPFSALDTNSSDILWQELLRLRSPETYILLSSHMLPLGKNPDKYLLLREHQVQMVPAARTTTIELLLKSEC